MQPIFWILLENLIYCKFVTKILMYCNKVLYLSFFYNLYNDKDSYDVFPSKIK